MIAKPDRLPARRSWTPYALGCSALAILGIVVSLRFQARAAEVAQERVQRHAERAGARVVLGARVVADGGSGTITLMADVKPFRQASLFSKADGFLRRLRVDKGDRVRAGDVVGFIDAADPAQQLHSARAELAVKQNVAARMRELRKEGLISAQDLDRAEADLQIAAAEAARLHTRDSYEILRAPFSGTVVARYVDPGAFLMAPGNADGGQSIVDIWDLSRLRVQVRVGQNEAPLVHVGDVVSVWSDAAPQALREERVTRVSGALDMATRTMLVEIEMDNRDRQILPGSFVHVRFSVKAPQTLILPVEAVTIRRGETSVVVIDGERAAFRRVEVGLGDGRRLRIRSGLSEGELVALYPDEDMVDHGLIHVVLPDNSAR